MSPSSKLKQRLVRRSPSRGRDSPDVWGLYEPDTGSIQYVCADPATKAAAVIDVVWNFDPSSCRFDTTSMEQVLDLVAEQDLTVTWVLETHPHADHVTAASLLKARTGAPTAIGGKVRDIAVLWRDIYHMPEAFDPDSDFDRLLAHGESIRLGRLEMSVMHSPGHTLGSITYVCGDAAFVHDTLMFPDAGTVRTDFPGGSAEALWESVQALLALPGGTRLFVGHDYGAEGRDVPMWEARVNEHKERNVHVADGACRAAWIERRTARDRSLRLPDRMLAALQVNLRGGRLPAAESDGRHYLKLPIDRF